MRDPMQVVTTVFTPTYQPTSPNPTVPAGTIIPYSIFTASFSQRSAADVRVSSNWRNPAMLTLGATIIGLFAGLGIFMR